LVDDDAPGGNDRGESKPANEPGKRRGVSLPVTAPRARGEPEGGAVGCVDFDFHFF